MATPPKATRARAPGAHTLRLEELTGMLESRLENPEPFLEALVTAAAKGHQPTETWRRLHDAVERDNLSAELAFAYEHIAADKRIKLFSAEQQAYVYLQAADFFERVFGDPDGAVAYAERAVASFPGHPDAFAMLERLLENAGQPLRLAKLYADAAASEKDRDQQLMLLSRASELVEGQPTAGDLSVDIYHRILKLEPAALYARRALEQVYVNAGRPKEATKILEQALLRDPPPDAKEARIVRERLVDLYTGDCKEPPKALPHVEGLLAVEPGHPRALTVAEALLENKATQARAAAALSDAYEKLGRRQQAAEMLMLELKLVRGPRRIEAQRRLAVLKQDVLGDPAGALELMAPIVSGDPGDDDLRKRYVALSLKLDQPAEAARLLSRALQTSRDPAVRARVSVDVGEVFLKSGDVKRAQASFEQAVEAAQDESATLQGARHLASLYGDAGDVAKLASALELVVRLEPDKEPRQAAARRLARLAEGETPDPERAIVAYRALIGSPWTDEALKKLEQLYEQTSSHEGLADVLELRAERSRDKEEARQLAFKAAELRTTRARDRAKALGAWRSLLERYGPSRAIFERMVPLLEHEQKWDELAKALDSLLTMSQGAERAPVLAQLAQVKLSRLGDAAGALSALREALAADPDDRSSRATVERLLASGKQRLEAARILEPLYRREAPGPGLVRALETRGELSEDAAERLTSFAEASELAEKALRDAPRALSLAGRALAEATAANSPQIGVWLEHVQRLGAQAGDPTARAELLVQALGSRPVSSADQLALARATGDALAVAGDIERAVEVYRRALDYQPSSAELLKRIDELLAQEGSPEDRIELYRSALEREQDPPRRRELLHTIATLQRRDLKDVAGAMQTWQRALSEDPRDLIAHQALLDLYTAQKNTSAVYTELDRALQYMEAERRNVTLLRMAEVAVELGDSTRALAHYRELMDNADLADDVLDAIEQLARERDDAQTVRIVLERRIASASDPGQRAALLERLGNVLAWQLGDGETAAIHWLEGARLSEGAAADVDRASRLYERVLGAVPDHREAAERLIELQAAAGNFEALAEAFDVVLRMPGGTLDPVTALLDLEQGVVQGGAGPVFAELVDRALERLDIDPPRVRRLLTAKARALAADPARQDAVASTYRRLLESAPDDAGQLVEEFQAFLAETPPTPERIQDRRFLFRWRSERSASPLEVLFEWAVAEEELGDVPAALDLYRRVVELDPERTDAWSELARLRAEQGDASGALESLEALRSRSTGAARAGIELTMARLLVDSMAQPDHALDLVEPLLAAGPADVDALSIVHRALAFPESRARAAELLEQAAQSADPASRAHVLQTLLEVSADTPELQHARPRWLKQLLESRIDDPEGSLVVALEAAQEMPEDSELWDAAERLARKLDRPQPVSEAYRAVMERQLDPEVAEELGRRMVEFYEEWFEEGDGVIPLLERVLALCPTASWAFDRLKLAFNAQARWDELFALYDGALVRTRNTPEHVDLLREASMAAKDFASDPNRAINYLEQLDKLAPGDTRIEASLERLYERHEHRRPLIELLSRRLERVEGRTRQALRARIAALFLDLSDPVPGFELVESMLGDATPAPSDVWDLLERLVALPQARESLLPAREAPSTKGKKKKDKDKDKPPRLVTVRERSAAHLKEHYQGQARTRDVLRMLEVEVETAPSEHERVSRLEESVRLCLEELDDAAGAFEKVVTLVGLEPAEPRHRQKLAELAERVGLQERRADLLVAVARLVDRIDVRVGLLAEAALVREEILGDANGAINLHLEVLDLAQTGPAALEAARRVDPLLAAAHRHDTRATVLERRADLEKEPEARRAVLGEAARVAFEELGDANRAVVSWRRRLDDDARDGPALDGVSIALEAAGRWDELVDALHRRAALGEDEDARRDWVRIARIHAEQRHDRPAAIDGWRAVRERFGRDRESFVALVDLLSAEARFPELASLLAEEANAEEDSGRRVELFERLGEVHRDRTGDVLEALRAFVAARDWQRAVEVAGASHPDRQLANQVCRTLLDLAVEAWKQEGFEAVPERVQPTGAAGAASWAVDELSARLEEEGSHDQVVSLLLSSAELPFARRRRRDLRREAACLYSDRLDDSASAIETFQGLLKEDPGDDVATASVTRLALLLEEQGRHAEIASLWEQQAACRAAAGDPKGSAALWARAAEIAEERLSDVERAIADHRQGAGLGGEACLEELARIHEGRGELRQAAEVLEWLCAQSSREALATRALRLAESYVAAGERKLARARLEHAAAVALDAGDVRKRLAEIYRDAKAWGPLAELLAAEALRASETPARLELLREAATLHLDKRDDPQAAVPLLTQAVDLASDDVSLRLLLSEALRRAERYDDAMVVLREQIKSYGSRRPKDRARVHLQLARVCLAAGKRPEALAELDIANKINPAHPGILHDLAKLAFEEGQFPRAEKMYRALLLVAVRDDDPDSPSRAEALLDLSEIAAHQDDPVRSTEFIESAFEAALEHPREAARLEHALRVRGRTELLARIVEARLKGAIEPREAARALADLVMLQASGGTTVVSGDLRERAEAIFEELEREAYDDSAWAALGRVFDFLGSRDAEAKILRRRVEAIRASGQEPDDAEPFYRLAELELASAQNSEQGVSLLEQAIDIRPDLARAAAILHAGVGESPEEGRAVRLLERIARETGDERALARALGLMLRRPGFGSGVLREGVALAKRLEDDALISEMLGSALSSGKLAREEEGWVRLELAGVKERAGDTGAAMELREQAAERLPPEERRKLLLDMARTMFARDDYERAARTYELLLQKEPADRDVWEPLLDVYRRLGDSERLVRLIEQTVPLVESRSDRARLRLEQAQELLEQPGREDEAASLLKEVLQEDPTQLGAAVLLSGLLERAGRQGELAELLALQLEAAKDRQDVVAISSTALRLGALLEQQDKRDEALDVYRGVLDWDAKNREALTAVLRLAEAEQDPWAIADAMEALLVAETGPAASELADQLAAKRRQIDDEAGAERALELGFQRNPAASSVRDELARRYTDRADYQALARLLQTALEAEPANRELVERLVDAHRRAEQPDLALAALNQLLQAGSSEPQLFRDRSQILSDLGRDEEALADLEYAHSQTGRYRKELAEALERAIVRAEPPQDTALTLRLTALLEQSGDTDGARARLAELAREAPQDEGVWRRLADLEAKSGSQDAAIAAYRKLLTLQDGEAFVQTALELADACERAGRFEDARAGLERALSRDPKNAGVRARLRVLYEATSASRELAQLALEDAAAATDVPTRLEHLQLAGRMLMTPDGDIDQAIGVLEEAQSLSPNSIDSAVLLARAYAAGGRGDQGMTVLDQTVQAYQGRRMKQLAAVYQEMSAIQLQEGFLAEALQSLTKAFEMDVRNGQLAMQLGQLALDLEDEEGAVRAFRAVTMMRTTANGDSSEGATPEAKAEAHYHLAVVARKQGDPRKAKILVSKALSENPDHEPARALLSELE